MTSAIKINEYGGPDALVWAAHDPGSPGPNEVRLRHTAIGVNFIDVYHRMGSYPMDLPIIPGVEGAGEVVALGSEVNTLKTGDRVAYAGPIGGYAEERVIAADKLVKLPDSISDEQAAAMMLQGMTAKMLLFDAYSVQPGDTILVHAAAGGTGLMLCQWANALGATVIGTVSTQEKAELAAANGCHHPLVNEGVDFVERVAELTQGKGVHAVYDSIGKTTFLASLDCLARAGTMVTFGQSSGPIEPLSPMLLAQKGSLKMTRPSVFDFVSDPTELQASAKALFDVVSSGKVKINIGQRFKLSDAKQAHEQLESRATKGSTILVTD